MALVSKDGKIAVEEMDITVVVKVAGGIQSRLVGFDTTERLQYTNIVASELARGKARANPAALMLHSLASSPARRILKKERSQHSK